MVGNGNDDCVRIVRSDFGDATGDMVYEDETGRVWRHDASFHQPGCIESGGLRGYLKPVKFTTHVCTGRKPRNVI